MKITNLTQKNTLAQNARRADRLLARVKGLLGTKQLPRGEALILDPCNSIHTFFMRYAIDVVFLDRSRRVVALLDSVPPFRLSPVFWKARLCIELSAGACREVGIKVGDLLAFVE